MISKKKLSFLIINAIGVLITSAHSMKPGSSKISQARDFFSRQSVSSMSDNLIKSIADTSESVLKICRDPKIDWILFKDDLLVGTLIATVMVKDPVKVLEDVTRDILTLDPLKHKRPIDEYDAFTVALEELVIAYNNKNDAELTKIRKSFFEGLALFGSVHPALAPKVTNFFAKHGVLSQKPGFDSIAQKVVSGVVDNSKLENFLNTNKVEMDKVFDTFCQNAKAIVDRGVLVSLKKIPIIPPIKTPKITLPSSPPSSPKGGKDPGDSRGTTSFDLRKEVEEKIKKDPKKASDMIAKVLVEKPELITKTIAQEVLRNEKAKELTRTAQQSLLQASIGRTTNPEEDNSRVSKRK